MSSFRVRFESVKCLSPATQEGFHDNSLEQPTAPSVKARRVKCDETFPVCLCCVRRGLICSSTPRLSQWQIETRWYSSPVDTIVNRRLLQYWLERVCRILVIDPEDNPVSFPVLEHIQESPALVHIIQSVSARHEQYFSAEVARIAPEERGKALASFRNEIGTGKTRPLLSMLTALLLALSHGADRDMTDLGKWHLIAARTLINKMLEDTSHPWNLNPLFRLCLAIYLYWDMGCSYLVHPDEQQELDTPGLSLAVQQVGHWHHPMYGSCTDLIFILGNLGRKHGLILLYRICGWNDTFTNPCLEETGLELLIHRYALETVNHLLQILASSNYLNFQSLPILTAGSELRREDNKLRADVRHRLTRFVSCKSIACQPSCS
ncbi:fungal-specific transcription factor domain-containing protein [Aspergillus flavus]|uniref:Fungal-specific transcription factor domain-containing protein n=1 Tax=Aspergillus flavus TaxID=5059 RepID=A0A5N6H7X0_ASPFL|nr:fungal-specific transcription factor domain-containing protein [Aspergillus flavus]